MNTFILSLILLVSLLNLAILVPISRIALRLLDSSVAEGDGGEPLRKLIATEEPGLLDLDMRQPNFSGVPRLD